VAPEAAAASRTPATPGATATPTPTTCVIDTTLGTRGRYAYDASNYRVVPTGVPFPRDAADVCRILAECRAAGLPVTCRGAGTSMAGNAVGPGVVLDFSRHMNRVLSIDPGARTATVEPGIVLDDLQAELAPHGVMFAPDPSSHSRATMGGMVGNDACGNHSVRFGRTSAHVTALALVYADGSRLVAERGGLRAADPDDAAATARARPNTAVLANGFSCQTQIGYLLGPGFPPARRLAELIDEALALTPAGSGDRQPRPIGGGPS